MASAKFSVKPEMIEWAIDQSPETAMDERMKSNVEKWMSGAKTPTLRQIEDFSRKLHLPLGYFFLDSPPKEEVGLLEYRTVGGNEPVKPSRNLIDTIYSMEDIQEWMRDYRIEEGFERNSVVGSARECDDPFAIAHIMREDLGLSDAWYKDRKSLEDSFSFLRDRLEGCGVLVMVNGVVGCNTHRPLNVEEFRAFALVDEFAPLIFINGRDTHGARLFSLLHEAAHIWIGENDFYNDDSIVADVRKLEKTCNAVAAEILVPKGMFLEKWDGVEGESSDKIENLAGCFRCGASVVARRALDAGKISREEYFECVDAAVNALPAAYSGGHGGDYYNAQGYRLDRNLMAALRESVDKGRTMYTEAFRLTNTNRKTFFKIADKMGV